SSPDAIRFNFGSASISRNKTWCVGRSPRGSRSLLLPAGVHNSGVRKDTKFLTGRTVFAPERREIIVLPDVAHGIERTLQWYPDLTSRPYGTRCHRHRSCYNHLVPLGPGLPVDHLLASIDR